MALYAYIKKSSPRLIRRFGKTSKIVPLVFLSVGLFMIAQVVFPIVSSYLMILPIYSPEMVSPVSGSYALTPDVFPTIVKAQEGTDLNSYRPSTWFPGAQQSLSAHENTQIQTYSLTIPKLKIDSATVEFGGQDLKKSLVAWPTSTLPGNFGVNIIFGHSELPQFASPSNYSGIFTSLMDLATGDSIFVDYDGIRYRYEVVDKKIIEPTDLSILEQRFDAAYVVLITCEPPGTLWKRGVVRARLAQI